MENQFESVKALVRQLHAPNKNVSRPHSMAETSDNDDNDRKVSVYSLPILAVEKPYRKRSLFDNAFRIPSLTITAPNSPETPENHLRPFGFVHFRRHSHSAVRYFKVFLVVPLIIFVQN